MAIRDYLFSIVLCTVLFGLGIAGYFWWNATTLERLNYEATDSSLILREFDRIGEHLDLLLISADLTIGAGETYTGQIARDQLRAMQERLSTLVTGSKLPIDEQAIARINELLDILEGHLSAQESVRTIAHHGNSELLAEFDGASGELVALFDDARQALLEITEDKATALDQGKRRALVYSVLVILVYLLASVCLAFWLSRRIARPLEALSQAADHAMKKGSTFVNPKKAFVQEIRELGGYLIALVSRLEDLVDARTLALREKTESLEAEIAERKAVQQELEQAKLLAEESSRVKSEFLSIMSHELRTPLNAVLGSLDLLRDSTLSREQASYVDIADDSGRALLALLGDVLDLSRIESEGVALNEETFRVRCLVDSTLDMVRIEAQKKGLELSAKIAPDVPGTLAGDTERLRQVLLNLAGNAVKFTEVGSIELRVTRMTDCTARPVLKFEVVDTGIGVPREKQAQIFSRFSQIDSSLSRKHSGVGLGLTICKHIVTAIGGECGVISEPGHGSTFWFTATLSRPEETVKDDCSTSIGSLHGEDTLPVSEREEKSGADRSVLIVEDSEVNQLIASAIIGKAGYQVMVAGDGYRALEILSEQLFDTVLLDIQMPGMDGLEVTRKIRSSSGPLSNIRIIACTANVMESTVEACWAAGVDDFTAKPIIAQDLLHKLASPKRTRLHKQA